MGWHHFCEHHRWGGGLGTRGPCWGFETSYINNSSSSGGDKRTWACSLPSSNGCPAVRTPTPHQPRPGSLPAGTATDTTALPGNGCPALYLAEGTQRPSCKTATSPTSTVSQMRVTQVEQPKIEAQP
ncbi:hypothetical protein AAFF_G00408520 [Aldrovandia affinis]|uniref:Uncharacterized protein n=1 Tax=Aldrovandia affinis TaxID=143900 RepID=A0AAD7WK08_9TELE|nr:hypothetical protein AAFF_G00408520 [Aldrovandia affinis]